jgi:hypothetical protein
MKQGFVITKNKQSQLFFSAKGSYDRPLWTKVLEEATVYHSDVLAHDAAKKLWKNANYAARVTPITEFEIVFKQPQDETLQKDAEGAPSNEPETVPPAVIDPVAADATADDALSADIDLDMQSDSRMNDEDRCECPMTDGQHEEGCVLQAAQNDEVNDEAPNTLSAGDKVMWNDQEAEVVAPSVKAEFVVIRVNGLDKMVPMSELKVESVEAFRLGVGERNALASERDWRESQKQGPVSQKVKKTSKVPQFFIVTPNNKFGPFATHDRAVMHKITMSMGDEAKIVQESASMPKRPDDQGNAPSDDKNPQLIPNLTEPKFAEIAHEDPVAHDRKPETDLDYSGAYQHGEKVKVPANVMVALKDSINVFRKAADYNNMRDDAVASFSMTVVGALEELQDALSLGTVDSIKQAQIKMTSWMNPITTNIPEVVRDFVLRGGRQPSLKDLFDMKRGEALIKRASKGFGNKE